MGRVLGVFLILGMALATVARAEAPYARLFAPGGLNGLVPGAALDYAVVEPPAAAPADAGAAPPAPTPVGSLHLRLSLAGTDGAADTVTLALVSGDAERQVGSFPASVGNPLIMYFLESVLRDMATRAGGSPFYIRNRIKDALLRDAVSTPVTLTYAGREIAAERISFSPFAKDAARERMGGFGAMELVFVVAPDLPGRFYSLAASAEAAPAGSAAHGYQRDLTLLAETAP